MYVYNYISKVLNTFCLRFRRTQLLTNNRLNPEIIYYFVSMTIIHSYIPTFKHFTILSTGANPRLQAEEANR